MTMHCAAGGIPPVRPDRIDPVPLPGIEPLPGEDAPDTVPESEPSPPDIDEPDRSPEEYPPSPEETLPNCGDCAI